MLYRPERQHRLAASIPRNRFLGSINVYKYGLREVVFMERPLEPNLGPSLADVLLSTFGSTNAGLVFFIFCEETEVLRVILVPLQHFLINETLHRVDSTE
jgi:hypothetical protein